MTDLLKVRPDFLEVYDDIWSRLVTHQDSTPSVQERLAWKANAADYLARKYHQDWINYRTIAIRQRALLQRYQDDDKAISKDVETSLLARLWNQVYLVFIVLAGFCGNGWVQGIVLGYFIAEALRGLYEYVMHTPSTEPMFSSTPCPNKELELRSQLLELQQDRCKAWQEALAESDNKSTEIPTDSEKDAKKDET